MENKAYMNYSSLLRVIICILFSLPCIQLHAVKPPSFLDAFLPGIMFTIKHALPYVVPNAIPGIGETIAEAYNIGIPSGEQTQIMADTLVDNDHVDFTKTTVEKTPLFFPSNRQLSVLYAAYKPEYDADSRLDDANKRTKWHASVAATCIVTKALFTKFGGASFNPQSINNAVYGLPITSLPAALNSVAAVYYGCRSYGLKNRIEAARNGDGDVAKDLTRKAINYAVEPIEE